MSHIDSTRRTPVATAPVAALVLLLACIGLVACGGSGKSSSTSTNASATNPAGAAGPGATSPGAGGPGVTAAGAARFKAMRECLQKNGVTLPKRPPGQRRGGPGGPGGPGGLLGGAAGPRLPQGVTRAQYEAAVKKCGGGAFAARGRFGRERLKSPAFQQSLAKFAACMRANGVNIPAPNTSGKGPIFNTNGINTASAQFRAASAKCRSALTGALRGGGRG